MDEVGQFTSLLWVSEWVVVLAGFTLFLAPHPSITYSSASLSVHLSCHFIHPAIHPSIYIHAGTTFSQAAGDALMASSYLSPDTQRSIVMDSESTLEKGACCQNVSILWRVVRSDHDSNCTRSSTCVIVWWSLENRKIPIVELGPSNLVMAYHPNTTTRYRACWDRKLVQARSGALMVWIMEWRRWRILSTPVYIYSRNEAAYSNWQKSAPYAQAPTPTLVSGLWAVNVPARLTCCLYSSLSRTKLGRTCVVEQSITRSLQEVNLAIRIVFLNKDDGAAARFNGSEPANAMTALLKAVMIHDTSKSQSLLFGPF